MADWITYIVRCADDSFYTGITTDLQRRIEEHNSGNKNGAAYTRSRRPVTLVYCESHRDRSMAARREAEIRGLGRAGKEQLIRDGRPA